MRESHSNLMPNNLYIYKGTTSFFAMFDSKSQKSDETTPSKPLALTYTYN